MYKQELIEKLASKTKRPITHADMTRIVNGLFEEIREAVANGDAVRIAGFGTFKSRNRSARYARNPQTGELMVVPARKAPGFKAGKAFKNAVNK